MKETKRKLVNWQTLGKSSKYFAISRASKSYYQVLSYSLPPFPYLYGLEFLFLYQISPLRLRKVQGNRNSYRLIKAQYLLLFRKFGRQLFYVYYSSFCGQIFKCAANPRA